MKMSEEAMETRDTALAMNNLAVSYREQGKLQEVDYLYERAAWLLESQSVGTGGSGTAGSGGSREEATMLSNRAWALCEAREWEKALPINERALRMSVKAATSTSDLSIPRPPH